MKKNAKNFIKMITMMTMGFILLGEAYKMDL